MPYPHGTEYYEKSATLVKTEGASATFKSRDVLVKLSHIWCEKDVQKG